MVEIYDVIIGYGSVGEASAGASAVADVVAVAGAGADGEASAGASASAGADAIGGGRGADEWNFEAIEAALEAQRSLEVGARGDGWEEEDEEEALIVARSNEEAWRRLADLERSARRRAGWRIICHIWTLLREDQRRAERERREDQRRASAGASAGAGGGPRLAWTPEYGIPSLSADEVAWVRQWGTALDRGREGESRLAQERQNSC